MLTSYIRGRCCPDRWSTSPRSPASRRRAQTTIQGPWLKSNFLSATPHWLPNKIMYMKSFWKLECIMQVLGGEREHENELSFFRDKPDMFRSLSKWSEHMWCESHIIFLIRFLGMASSKWASKGSTQNTFFIQIQHPIYLFPFFFPSFSPSLSTSL